MNSPSPPVTGLGVVLVIDDSDVDREAMIDVLTESGLEVHGLHTPIGATRIARDLDARVVVVDQNLPALDGNKLTALFRSNRSMRHVRIVLVSGNDGPEMEGIARVAQADAFVSKSRIHRDLAATVRKLIAQ